MVPGEFILVDRVFRLASVKIDQKALESEHSRQRGIRRPRGQQDCRDILEEETFHGRFLKLSTYQSLGQRVSRQLALTA